MTDTTILTSRHAHWRIEGFVQDFDGRLRVVVRLSSNGTTIAVPLHGVDAESFGDDLALMGRRAQGKAN